MSSAARALEPPSLRVVHEVPATTTFPVYVHAEWREQYPWLVQGVTGRGADGTFDMSAFGETPSRVMLARWADLREHTGIGFAVHARQVHGARVLCHLPAPDGILLADAADGHATAHAGVLMVVSTADCVPVSIVDPRRRAVALLHAGWRGIAAGILEAGLDTLGRVSGGPRAAFRVHLGPAICGRCYEVGPEVLAALGSAAADRARTIDLRALLASRARAAGIPFDQLTVSGHCTRCGDRRFHSHRAGDRARQVAFLGVRAANG